MVGRPSIDLDADQIVGAAVDLFHERGLEAVSMRNVSARLGVSPVPLYRRVGNKDALLDAMADRVLADVAPVWRPGEPWRTYATEWVRALRDRLVLSPDTRLLIGDRRAPFVEASRPLVDALRAEGFAPDAAVQACRLLIWATVGFAVVQTGRSDGPLRPPTRRRPGGDPSGVTRAEADHLFDLHIGYVLDGIERDHAGSTTGRAGEEAGG